LEHGVLCVVITSAAASASDANSTVSGDYSRNRIVLFVIELEGVLFSLENAYWDAYGRVAGEIGLARADTTSFWQVIRTGQPIGQVLRGAKPGQVQTFQARFAEVLEDDECVGQFAIQERAQSAVEAFRRFGRCALVTAGRNREARQRLLDQHDERFAMEVVLQRDAINAHLSLAGTKPHANRRFFATTGSPKC